VDALTLDPEVLGLAAGAQYMIAFLAVGLVDDFLVVVDGTVVRGVHPSDTLDRIYQSIG
jgi:hypothetical protein